MNNNLQIFQTGLNSWKLFILYVLILSFHPYSIVITHNNRNQLCTIHFLVVIHYGDCLYICLLQIKQIDKSFENTADSQTA